MTYLKEFAQRVRNARTKLNMSQAELAEASGYTTRVSITKIEQGKINVPHDKLAQSVKRLSLSKAQSVKSNA